MSSESEQARKKIKFFNGRKVPDEMVESTLLVHVKVESKRSVDGDAQLQS